MAAPTPEGRRLDQARYLFTNDATGDATPLPRAAGRNAALFSARRAPGAGLAAFTQGVMLLPADLTRTPRLLPG